MNEIYTVWVGGVEATDHYLTREKAHRLADEYKQDGYEDVQIEINPKLDLFEIPFKELPEDLQEVLNKYLYSEFTYTECSDLVESLNAIGYTCEYGLDAEPFALRKLDNIKRDKIKKHVKDMLMESFESMINNIEVLLNDDEEAVNNWEPNVNPMILPKCMVTALLEHESMQYQAKGTSFEKKVKKKVKELRNYL